MKILVVDSDNIAFFILKRCFICTGLCPLFVQLRTAAEAINYIKKGAGDIIFLEPVLPDMPFGEILDVFAELNIFIYSKVCLLTTLMASEPVTSRYPFFKKFTKPFIIKYIAELSIPVWV